MSKRVKFLLLPVAVIAGILIGLFGSQFIKQSDHGQQHDMHKGTDAGAEKVTEWTCSMHPQVRQPKQGKCPICFMDLIPVTASSSASLDIIQFEHKLQIKEKSKFLSVS